MAVLSDPDRAGLHAQIMHDLSVDHDSCAVTKADLRAALNAADDWANSNAASFNSALPLPARTALTAQQKARLLMAVIKRRFEVS